MKKVVSMVAERAGISESQAQTAVSTVASFLKDKLPPGVAGQVDSYLNDNGSANTGSQTNTDGKSGGMADKAKGLADKAGGMMGK